MDDSIGNSSQDEDKRVPTFCLIKDIPSQINFDEKSLRIALKKQTTGLKRCLMMTQQKETTSEDSNDDDIAKTYAIALFESKEAALDAAEPNKVQLAIDSNNTTVSLVIIPIQPDRALAPEAFFKETITIDGEEVPKSELADSTGLASALKSFSGFRETVNLEKGPGGVAKWCKSTRKGQDCPFGNQCWYIHSKKYQTTITPKYLGGRVAEEEDNNNDVADDKEENNTTSRIRERDEDDDSSTSNNKNNNNNNNNTFNNVIVPKLAAESMSKLPQNLRLDGGRTISIDKDLLEKVFLPSSTDEADQQKLQDILQKEIDAIKKNSSSSCNSNSFFFVKFDFPHGSASDMILSWVSESTKDDSSSNPSTSSFLYEGTDSTPNAIKRDVLMHSCWKHSHKKSLAVQNAKEAIQLLKSSPKARSALRKYIAKVLPASSTTIPVRIDLFQESLWCPPSQYSMLIRTNVSRRKGNHLFVGAAQRVSWIIVDVANRRFENPPSVVAQQKLVTEQLDAANIWRQASIDSVRDILNKVVVVGGGVGDGEQNNKCADDVFESASSCFFCVNIAVPGEMDQEKDPRQVNLDHASARILSIHDADEALARSSLLPFCVNSNNNNKNKNLSSSTSTAVVVPKITWRIRTPFPDQVPNQLQTVLEKYGRSGGR